MSFTVRGGNIGVFLTENYVIMVDDQFETISKLIKAEVTKISDKPIRFLINTHHHSDHTDGNAFFKNLTVLVSHEKARQLMKEGRKTEVTYQEAMTLYPDGKEIQVFHLGPGHTSGDSVVYVPDENVVHMGDLLFDGVFPYLDPDGGADTANWIIAIDKVIARVPADVKVIPGHGKVTDINALRRFQKYLRYTRDEVGRALAAGKSEAEALASINNAFKDIKPIGKHHQLGN